jgi:hypothetical protein
MRRKALHIFKTAGLIALTKIVIRRREHITIYLYRRSPSREDVENSSAVCRSRKKPVRTASLSEESALGHGLRVNNLALCTHTHQDLNRHLSREDTGMDKRYRKMCPTLFIKETQTDRNAT